ncbi:hypothetical protein MNV49_002747, partial [Pseudohyphozyma bogoriensis]
MFKVTPVESSAGFGAFIEGIDVNNLDEPTFLKLQTAVYKYKLVVVKGQKDLTPTSQHALNVRFDPKTQGVHGGTGTRQATSAIPTATFSTHLPEAPDVRIVGKGLVPKDHFGTKEDQVLAGGTHVGFHETPLSPKELDAGDSRLWRWH